MTANNPYVVFVANRGPGLAGSRQLLLQHFMSLGWQVVVATAAGTCAAQLAAIGAIVESVSFNRGGLAPFSDMRAYLRLRRIYRRYRPALIHHFNAKPVILGGLAACSTGQDNVANTITGLGHAFINGGAARHLAAAGYKGLLARSKATIFQNPDDRLMFVSRGWVPARQAHLIISAGVNTAHFRPISGEKAPAKAPRVLMAARLLWQKGVGEFIEAATLIKERYSAVSFELAGEWDAIHPDAVDERHIRAAAGCGSIEFLGYLRDMSRELPARQIFVLPSYREGAPRVLLEAAACGLPIVTTDVPGCRETVLDGVTGLLVPPRDGRALAKAIIKLLRDPELRQQMGRAGRQRVESNFDVRTITHKYLALYREIGIAV